MRLKQLALMLCLSLPLIASTSFAAARKAVSLQLVWKHQFQFAGYYMAQQKGFYRDAGLDVTIHEYQGDLNPVDEVLQQRRDFAVGRSSILADNASGAKIVALLAAFQQSPLMLLTRADSGITHPKDLRGKKIMMTSDAEQQVELLAMLMQAGIDGKAFMRQEHSFDIHSLIDGSTDAMASYLSNEPLQMQQQDVPYHILHPQDYGFSMYSDILFTSQAYLSKHPKTVAQFRQASIKGWRYAFNHIEETVEVILQQYNSQQRSRQALQFEGESLRPLAFDEAGHFGQLTEEKLNSIAQLFLLFNIIDKAYKFSNFIYRGPVSSDIPLSDAELLFLQTHQPLKVCSDPLWPPYSLFSGDRYAGIIPDYLQLLTERLGITTEHVRSDTWSQSLAALKAGRCDLIAGAMQTPQLSQSLSFTRPYLSMPAVLAILQSQDAPQQLSDLLHQPLAIIRDSAFAEIISSRYPDAHLVPVDSVAEGLQKLLQGEVGALLDAADSISEAINRDRLAGIKIVDPVQDSWDISIAMTPQWAQTPLLAILDKAIQNITPAEKDQIRRRWIYITYHYKVDYTQLWQGLAGLLLAALFVAYRYRVIQRHNKALASLASHDQLTGLYNRRMLTDSLQDCTAVAERYARPLALIFVDIDDFKLINDRYGHNLGDTVLQEVAQSLRKNCRISDIIGRWGGEEFLLLLPESTLDNALNSAEKLRRAIEQQRFSSHPALRVTCSFGVAEYHQAESRDSFVNRADQALYQAKKDGRNCTRSARR